MVATPFMVTCQEEVSKAFGSVRLDPPEFSLAGVGEQEFLTATFVLNGEQHRIEIAKDIPMLYVSDRRLECYMPEEFANEAALARAFGIRLRRLLSGGSWTDPEEKSYLGRLMGKLRG